MTVRRLPTLVVGLLALVAIVAGGAPAIAAGDAAASPTGIAASSAGDPAPFVVIMDTSGSMSDRVNGVVKLDAAKRSIGQVLRNQPNGSDYGIWTYPAGTGCAGGRFLVDPGSRTSTDEIVQAIDSLTAAGSTPTGPAIQSVVDALTARGFAAANLVLVSDGQSTCGGNPCQVAEKLAATTFQLSVHAVGFDIGASGRAELECIADATGGRYIDVVDGDELEDALDRLSRAGIDVAVGYDSAPLAGRPLTITARVSNPSAIDAHDVRVTLAFRDADATSIFPAVVPATILVGNLAAGADLTRSWTVIAGEQGRSETGAFTVVAWGADAIVARAAGQFTTRADDFTAGDAGPLLTDDVGNLLPLAILGDSFSSGEGTFDYRGDSGPVAEECHRSERTYLYPLYQEAGVPVDILACSGATTGDLMTPQRDGKGFWRASSQLAQLASLDSAPGAAVMSMGGNDLGFADIIAYCVHPGYWLEESILPGLDWGCSDNQDYRDSVLTLASLMTLTLPETYESVWRILNRPSAVAQRDGRSAPLIVLGYPQLTHDTKFGACGLGTTFSAPEVAFANEIAMTLNAAIKASVTTSRNAGYEVYFVDRIGSAFQPDHSVCATFGSWVNKISIGASGPNPESYHPNVDGYRAITEGVIGWSRVAEPVPPTADVHRTTTDEVPVEWVLEQLVEVFRPVPVVPLPDELMMPLERGSSARVQATGYAPRSPVMVTIHSAPRLVGAFRADETGAIDAVVDIPHDIALGGHELTLGGLDPEGGFREVSRSVVVTEPVPVGVWASLAGAVLCGVGAVVLFALSRRQPRPRT